jgi:hypothetical protein
MRLYRLHGKSIVLLYSLGAAAAASGCASADRFSAMTAADHEQAARQQGGDGATAAEHLAAARALRDAETAACSDVPLGERALGPFAHPERIARIEEVRARTFPKAPPQTVGIAVYVRATPGVTAQWLGREIECAAAHQVAEGTSTDAVGLATRGATARVVDTSSGFKVLYTSGDIAVAQRLLDIGRALVPNAS